MKTHDGIGWMSEYDGSPDAVSGPQQVARLAAFFEEAGVPFHAWCVVKGLEPAKEAAMCAEVLAAGARSITVDLEPYAGFWQATPREAMVFGDTLRRLQPAAWVVVSVDPRPWQMDRIPLKEFSSFSDEFAPQIYWDQLSSPENHQAFARNGITPGPEGITPRFLLDAAMGGLRQYGLPIQPIGQGSTDKPGAWKEFLDHAFTLEAEAVSVWRFGVTLPEVWPLLKENPPRPLTYIVQPGDTLSALAVEWHTAVPAIAEVNGISNPNLIYVGQELIVPRGSRSRPSSPSSPSSSQPPPSRHTRCRPATRSLD